MKADKKMEKLICTCFAKDNCETIKKHNENLLKNLDILKKYEYVTDREYSVLKSASVFHDLGKINPKFQKRLKTKAKFNPQKEIPHNILSLFLMDFESIDRDILKSVVYCILNHHYRENINANFETVLKNRPLIIENLNDISDEYNLCKCTDETYANVLKVLMDIHTEILRDSNALREYSKILGFFNKLDYCASAYIDVESREKFLLAGVDSLGYTYNDLQKFSMDNCNRSIVVTAACGSGKTEAALLWIGDEKGFFTLHMKCATNAIYERVLNLTDKKNLQKKVSLLDSDSMSVFLSGEEKYMYDALDYYKKSRMLSSQLTVSTVDSIFNFIFFNRKFEFKYATVSCAKVVIDEIQSYDADLLAIIMATIKELVRCSVPVMVMTATLSSFIEEELKKINSDFVFFKSDLTKVPDRHNMKIIDKKLNAEDIVNHFRKNKKKHLVVCNTVKKAQKIYEEIREMGVENVKILHSRFLKRRRDEIEKDIIDIGRTEHEEDIIYVTTQIVEASLDLDFDYLFTELSDLAGLFQRIGRLNRKGLKDISSYNAFVYTVLEDGVVGNVIDKDMYELSLKALSYFGNGIYSETDKDMLLKEYITLKNLKNTNYYKKYLSSLEEVSRICDRLAFKEAGIRRSALREIDSTNYFVADENGCLCFKDKIDELMDEIESLKKDKGKNCKEIYIRQKELMDYTVSLNNEFIKGVFMYRQRPCIRCKYTEEKGVEFLKKIDYV